MKPRPFDSQRRSLRAGFLFAVAGLVAVALTGAARAAERTDELRREIAVERGVREVSIDNVFGPVRVHAGTAGRVALEVRRHATARREAALDDAFREVTLTVTTAGDRLELVQDGPFRCGEHGWGRRGCDWDPDYDVSWEWDVTVPADLDLRASTVNGGGLEIEGAHGRVHAANVNGSVRLRGLAGEVQAETVNGSVEAEFERAPPSASSFVTVNGKVELVLPRQTSAEIAVDAMHGEVYTDFEAEAVPVKAVAEREGASGHRYRFKRETVVRLGQGGVRLECATVNGDIVVRAR